MARLHEFLFLSSTGALAKVRQRHAWHVRRPTWQARRASAFLIERTARQPESRVQPRWQPRNPRQSGRSSSWPSLRRGRPRRLTARAKRSAYCPPEYRAAVRCPESLNQLFLTLLRRPNATAIAIAVRFAHRSRLSTIRTVSQTEKAAKRTPRTGTVHNSFRRAAAIFVVASSTAQPISGRRNRVSSS